MEKFVVHGPCQLNGTVRVGGAKNAVLPLMFSTLLVPGRHVFDNVPRLRDVRSAAELLRSLGCQVTIENAQLIIDVPEKLETHAAYDIVRKMRASILCLGPLVARMKKAEVSLPGGCAIGSRPINMHLEALRTLGADIQVEGGYVVAQADRLQGGSVLFDQVTVGGTENLLMAAVLSEGRTVIENAAKEPEVVDLAEYLVAMGAKIQGHGSSVIMVDGGAPLSPATHTVVADRIEAGTLILAAAITGGRVRVEGCRPEHLEALLMKLKESGLKLEVFADAVEVQSSKALNAVDITTSPHPLFPTDLQAQFMSLMTQAHGTSVIAETVFENRFMHVQELNRLSANITPKSHVAVVRGPSRLKGAPVMATDLRASACLVLAGLVAEGATEVKRIYHLDRGYDRLEDKLNQLGARIERLTDD